MVAVARLGSASQLATSNVKRADQTSVPEAELSFSPARQGHPGACAVAASRVLSCCRVRLSCKKRTVVIGHQLRGGPRAGSEHASQRAGMSSWPNMTEERALQRLPAMPASWTEAYELHALSGRTGISHLKLRT